MNKKNSNFTENVTIQSKGFTLLELSLVITIIGLIAIPLLQYYKIFLINEQMIKTKDNIAEAATAIQIFGLRYPCPSDRSLSPTDANYGMEQCTGMPDCDGSGTQGICIANGNRDIDSSSTIGDIPEEQIIIGGIPSKNFAGEAIEKMKASYMIDGWGSKMTYAVGVSLSDPSKSNKNNDFNMGVIGAISEHNLPTAGVSNDAQFVIVSHGKDGAGSFTLEGTSKPCSAAPVKQAENCNDDGTFMQALGAYEGAGNLYYDDASYFYTQSAGELWYVLTDSGKNQSPHINNINTQNIGINTATPSEKLHVNGTIKADTIRTDAICNNDGSQCLNPAVGNIPYSGGGSLCPTGQIVSSIENGTTNCAFPDFSNQLTVNRTATCPAGHYITTIKSNGHIICTDGVEY
jgi:prepilin-type N-terminal cleavage/methylation domain-containing protein